MSELTLSYFVFTEKLSNFWSAFEKRLSLDKHLHKSLNVMNARGLLTDDQYFHIIYQRRNEPFKYRLISESVKTNVNDRTQTSFEHFTNFLRQREHYDIMYKQWSELSKNTFKNSNTFDVNISTCSISDLCVYDSNICECTLIRFHIGIFIRTCIWALSTTTTATYAINTY